MDVAVEIARWVVGILGGLGVLATAPTLSDHPWWGIRGWVFPRAQVGAVTLSAGVIWAVALARGDWLDAVFLGATGLATAWQAWWILPYSPLAPREVQSATGDDPDRRLRLVVSNVLTPNERFDRWRQVMRAADPDVLVIAEADDRWIKAAEPLRETMPHVVSEPLDNLYGLAVMSRYPLHDTEIRYLVQDDVPSVRALVELPSGDRVLFYAVHPRPPHPDEWKTAGPRDAELMLVASEVADDGRPAVVAGDLNDVAWSRTTRLFQQVSGMLDPRRGRGLCNTFHADWPWMRFPLDHVFHSPCFRLVRMERLPHVGSDHFPVLAELALEPAACQAQEPLDYDDDDADEAQERVSREEERQGGRFGAELEPKPGDRS